MDKRGLFGKLIILAIIIFFLFGVGMYFKNGSKGDKAVQGIGKIVEDLNVTDKILNVTGIVEDSEINKTKNETSDDEIDVSKIDQAVENNSDFNNIVVSNITLNYSNLSN